MNALRQIHQALVPGGALLDMHPVPPSTRAEVAGGVVLGEFDDAQFMGTVAAAEAAIERSGLFTREAETHFDYRERYDDAAELLTDIEEGWEGCRIPDDVRARIVAADAPVDVCERVVLRRFSRSPG